MEARFRNCLRDFGMHHIVAGRREGASWRRSSRPAFRRACCRWRVCRGGRSGSRYAGCPAKTAARLFPRLLALCSAMVRSLCPARSSSSTAGEELRLAPTNTDGIPIGAEARKLAGLADHFVGARIRREFAQVVQLGVIVREIQIEDGLAVAGPVRCADAAGRQFQFAILRAVGVHHPQRLAALAVEHLRAHGTRDGGGHQERGFDHGARIALHHRHHANPRGIAAPLHQSDVRAIGPHTHSAGGLPAFRHLVELPLLQAGNEGYVHRTSREVTERPVVGQQRQGRGDPDPRLASSASSRRISNPGGSPAANRRGSKPHSIQLLLFEMPRL